MAAPDAAGVHDWEEGVSAPPPPVRMAYGRRGLLRMRHQGGDESVWASYVGLNIHMEYIFDLVSPCPELSLVGSRMGAEGPAAVLGHGGVLREAWLRAPVGCVEFDGQELGDGSASLWGPVGCLHGEVRVAITRAPSVVESLLDCVLG